MSQTKRRWSTGLDRDVNVAKSGRLAQPQPEPAPLPTAADLLAAAEEYRAAVTALGEAERAENRARSARIDAEERAKVAEEELVAVSLKLGTAGTPPAAG